MITSIFICAYNSCLLWCRQ